MQKRSPTIYSTKMSPLLKFQCTTIPSTPTETLTEMRKKSLTLGKPSTKYTLRKMKQILNANQHSTEATAICLNRHTRHVKNGTNSLMQFSKCRTKQNNKIPRLS